MTVSPNIPYSIETIDRGFILTIKGDDLREAAIENFTLTLSYTAELNRDAIVAPRDDSIVDGNVNVIKLQYRNYVQESSVDVNTTLITLVKYDSDDDTKTPIADATFQLLDADGNVINLYEVTPNEEYRMVTSEDSGSMDHFTTAANKTIIISGLDADLTYYLRETQAPAGYNMVGSDISFQPAADLSLVVEVPNSTGALLPSTGGMGTTILYIVGGALVIGGLAFILLRNH